ncbi:protein TsetseEP-like [Eucalyptus grandis]|uniref:protein TsetseEP-like n=1 Tax=Eucalyptus grandis TaxID=71139 RepID=UPI00192EEA8B|nr:protein TsetseEP-like [Eucalyptus grandis]
MASHYFVIILVASIFYSIGDIGVSDCHLGDGEPMDVDNDPMDVDGYIEAKASPDPIPAPINYEEPLSSSKVLPEVGLDTIPAPINYKEPPPSSKVLPEASPDPIPVPVHNEEPKPPPSGSGSKSDSGSRQQQGVQASE